MSVPSACTTRLAVGERITLRHKTQTITHVQLAEMLRISQQAMNSFEKGRRCVSLSLLPVIAQALDIRLDALVNDEARTTAAVPKKRGPQKKIQQQTIEKLPIAKQCVIAQVINSMLQSNP